MQTKTVEYYVEKDGEKPVDIKLVVSEATVFVGMRRAVLQGRAESWVALRREAIVGDEVDEVDEVDEADEADINDVRPGFLDLMAGSLAARILYPDLVACVTEAEGLSPDTLSVDGFLALPEQLTQAWETAVYELNPHWLPGGQGLPDEAAEKKG